MANETFIYGYLGLGFLVALWFVLDEHYQQKGWALGEMFLVTLFMWPLVVILDWVIHAYGKGDR